MNEENMQDTTKNLTLGIFVAIAIALIVWILMFLHPKYGDGGLILHVCFPDIEKLNIGTRVTYAGRPVGEVIKIRELAENEREPKGEHGKVFTYVLTLSIDSSVKVYSTDDITLATSGLMGEKYVSIVPRYTKDASRKLLTSQDLIYSSGLSPMEETFQSISSITKKADYTISELAGLLKDNRKELEGSLRSIQNAAKSFDIMLERANKLDIVGSIHNAANQSDVTLKTVNEFIKELKNSNGSLSKFLVQNEFYDKTISTLNKANLFMSDLNNYGILFHLDKGWQRERRKRIQELDRLSSPQDFRNYLDEEMASISSSLSRVGSALDRVNNDLDLPKGTIKNPQIREDLIQTFKDLQFQIKQLETTLEHYQEEATTAVKQ